MISAANRAKIEKAQAEAWKKVSAIWSMVESAGTDERARKVWLSVLDKEISRQKKTISDLIDQTPDDPL